MKSELDPHKLAAVYPDAAAADAAIKALGRSGLDDIEVVRLAPGVSDIDFAIEPEPEQTRNTLATDAFTGSAAGTVAGALLAGAATVMAPTLFVSAPVVGPLIILGYGALVGGTAGALHGLKVREVMLAGLVKDAIKAGYHAVVVHAANDEALHRAQAVISETLAEETAHT